MNIYIFGAGKWGGEYYEYAKKKGDTVLGFIDSNSTRHGQTYRGLPIASADVLSVREQEYNQVVVAIWDENSLNDVLAQLSAMQIPEEKILIRKNNHELFLKMVFAFNPYDEQTDPRVCWLRQFSAYVYEHGIGGNCAECGVFRGEFSEYINKYFKGRSLHLFDTFEGFDSKDINFERSLNSERFKGGLHFGGDSTRAELVLNRMPHPENIIMHKGYFPDTASGLSDRFCFVNLDMDLYKPTLDALRVFWPLMEPGGIILMHDYMPEINVWPGIKKSVREFEEELGHTLPRMPIYDDYGGSIAIVKN
jgi:hypothetical protein